MKYHHTAIAMLLCAVTLPTWSGVPNGVQRTNQNQNTDTRVSQASTAKLSSHDACSRIETLEKEIVSLSSRVDNLLAQLRTRSTNGK